MLGFTKRRTLTVSGQKQQSAPWSEEGPEPGPAGILGAMLTVPAPRDRLPGATSSESSGGQPPSGRRPETSDLAKIKFSLTRGVEITLMLGQLAMPFWRLT